MCASLSLIRSRLSTAQGTCQTIAAVQVLKASRSYMRWCRSQLLMVASLACDVSWCASLPFSSLARPTNAPASDFCRTS